MPEDCEPHLHVTHDWKAAKFMEVCSTQTRILYVH